MLKVHSIESLGTFDGPGIRLVIFLQGCNLKCLYCANPDTIPGNGGTIRNVEDILQLARSQRPFFGKKGGLTFSGGEPLLQAKALIPLFQALKNEGFNTCLDTNGSILNAHVKKLLSLTDTVLLDIKEMNPEAHLKISGTSNTKSLHMAAYLHEMQIPTWIRYVLVPGYTDKEEHLHQLGRFIQPMSNVQKIEIQPYHKLGAHKYEALGWRYHLKEVLPNSPEQLKKVKKIFRQYIREVIIN